MLVNENDFIQKNWNEFVHLEALREYLRTVPVTHIAGVADDNIESILNLNYGTNDHGETVITLDGITKDGQTIQLQVKPEIEDRVKQMIEDAKQLFRDKKGNVIKLKTLTINTDADTITGEDYEDETFTLDLPAIANAEAIKVLNEKGLKAIYKSDESTIIKKIEFDASDTTKDSINLTDEAGEEFTSYDLAPFYQTHKLRIERAYFVNYGALNDPEVKEAHIIGKDLKVNGSLRITGVYGYMGSNDTIAGRLTFNLKKENFKKVDRVQDTTNKYTNASDILEYPEYIILVLQDETFSELKKYFANDKNAAYNMPVKFLMDMEDTITTEEAVFMGFLEYTPIADDGTPEAKKLNALKIGLKSGDQSSESISQSFDFTI